MGFTVAIIGRPNVGKSTLFNRIIGKRVSIVDDKPGVTRDRIYAQVEWRNKKFTLVDTGGIEPESEDIIFSKVLRQVEVAIENSDVIIFLLDAKEGLTPTDEDVAQILRKSKKPVILAVNKVDNFEAQSEAAFEFFKLGFGEPVLISAAHGINIGDLLDRIVDFIPEETEAEYEEDVIKVAVVGRPNVGKSSLVNAILGEERVIVSDIPGTTRDAIDTLFEYQGKKMVLIDTAGLRRKSRVKEDIEFYSNLRAIGAIERADVVLMVIDATSKIAEQDKKIAGLAHEEGKAMIIVVNKWDAIEKDDKTIYKFTEEIKEEFKFAEYAPVVFVSALTKKRVPKILELIEFVMNYYTFRVEKKMLRDLLEEATTIVPPPVIKGKRLKIYEAEQVAVKPPTFSFVVNEPELLHFSYQRYLENKLREKFGFEGTPIFFKIKKKEKKKD